MPVSLSAFTLGLIVGIIISGLFYIGVNIIFRHSIEKVIAFVMNDNPFIKWLDKE